MTPDDLLPTMMPVRPDHDAILVVGGASDTLDLLRLATVRSDDVVLVMARATPAIRRFCENFAVELRLRAAHAGDLAGANAVLIAIGEAEAENVLLREARRRAVPVHVGGRPLVSDFSLIEMLERKSNSFARDPAAVATVPIVVDRDAAC